MRFALASLAVAFVISPLASALHTDGSNIVDSNNNVVKIKGVNYFGGLLPPHGPEVDLLASFP